MKPLHLWSNAANGSRPRTHLSVIFTLLCLFSLAGNALAAPLAFTAGSSQQAGTVEPWTYFELLNQTGGNVMDVEMANGIGYVAMGQRLAAVNFSNPAKPVLLGQSDLHTSEILRVKVFGDNALVLLRGKDDYIGNLTGSGLRVDDISQPGAPKLTNTFLPANGGAWEMDVYGQMAYVVEEYGLWIVDLQNPAELVTVNHFNVGVSTKKVVVAPNGNKIYAYVLSAGKFSIVDVTDPANPSVTGALSFPTVTLNNIVVQGAYAYLGARNQVLTIDISNPDNPVNVTQTAPAATKVSYLAGTASGTHLYMTDFYGKLHVFSLQTPENLAEVITLNLWGVGNQATSITVAGSYYLLLSNSNGGLRVVDASNPQAPAEVAVFSLGAGMGSVAKAGDSLYTGYNTFTTWNAVSNYSPQPVAVLNTWGSVFAAEGGYAYLLDYPHTDPQGNTINDLRIVDVHNPSAPVQVGSYSPPNRPYAAVYYNQKVYLADGDALLILDVSNPANPQPVGSYKQDSKSFSSIAVAPAANNPSKLYAYAGWSDVMVVDVTDPANPVLIGSISITGSMTKKLGVATLGAGAAMKTYVVAGENNGVELFDVTDPAAIQNLGSAGADVHHFASLAMLGNRLFLCDADYGVRVYEFGPDGLKATGVYTQPESVEDVVVVDHLIHVVSEGSGMYTAWLDYGYQLLPVGSGGVISDTAQGTTIDIPTGAFTSGTDSFSYFPLYPGNVHFPYYQAGVGHYFQLLSPSQPVSAYSIKVQYEVTELGAAQEDTLALFYWDGQQWVKEPTSSLDLANHTVSAAPTHLSKWAVLGTRTGTHAFLPLTMFRRNP